MVVITLTLVGWFVPFEYNNAGYCGESPLYRYRFGVYACELDHEGHPDFQCYAKVGGFMSYLGLKALECEERPLQTR